MAEHLTEEKILLFHTGRLAPEELLSAGDHLASCDGCASLAAHKSPMSREKIKLLEMALTASPELGPHLRYEQLESYASGRVSEDERVAAEKHIASCRECEEDIRQLQSLAAAMQEPSHFVAASERNDGLLSVWASFFNSRKLAFASVLLVSMIIAGWFYSTATLPAGNDDLAISPAPVVRPEPPADVAAAIPPQIEEQSPAAVPPETAASDETKPGPELRVSLRDGGKTVGLTHDGEIEGYAALPPGLSRSVRDALASGLVKVSEDVSGLRGARGALMNAAGGAAGGLRLNGPAGEVVMTDTPRLSWQPLPGAESYIAEVFDENFNKVASSGPQPDTTWSPKLPRGRTYVWQVTATRGLEQFKAPQRPAPDAKFKIISVEKMNQIQALKRQRSGSSLVLGLAYAETGLLHEAAAEFEKLARANPDSTIPRKLLTSVRKELSAK